MDAVRASQHEIYEGNSYEVCLTAQTNARIQNPSPELFFELYRRQRAPNSAPYVASGGAVVCFGAFFRRSVFERG